MPVEIKELNIKVTITEAPDDSVVGSTESENNMLEPTPAIIEACVEKVLEILKSKAER